MIENYSMLPLVGLLFGSGLAIAGAGFAVWAWRTLSISAPFWVLAVMFSFFGTAFVAFQIDVRKIDRAFEQLSSDGYSLGEVWRSVMIASPAVIVVCLWLIAVAEILRAGPRLNPEFQPGRHQSIIFSVLHSCRPLFGLLAVAAALAPKLALWWWFRLVQ
ncbi:MAG: hypothetical protein K1X78_25555 [Verrucomicrobiaceae bacterium]|nr:hypothetical protein [Verrucomicrobiaceae bacterium]